MQRSNHNNYGFWLKEFKYTKTNPYVSKYYLDDSAFIVYSISVTTNPDGSLKITLPTNMPLNAQGLFELYYGQHFSPQRNLDLFKKFYLDFDLSINTAKSYDSFSDNTNIFKLTGDSVFDFSNRLKIEQNMSNLITRPLENFYSFYLGYNRIRNYKYNGDLIEDYEALSSIVLAEMDPTCFKWLEIRDGYYANPLTDDDLKSSTLILDFKLNIDINKIIAWIEENFTDRIVELQTILGSQQLDFNLIFYPPSHTGMQLLDIPEVISPAGILKTKVVTEVKFEVRKSLVDNSQKIFEIYFLDKDNRSVVIFKDDSVSNPNNFFIESKDASFYLKQIELENSVFEDIGKFDYPVDNFIVTYKIPSELVKYLADTLNYTIQIKMTDLTSERRDQ